MRALAAAAAATLVAVGCVSAGYGAPAGPTDTTPPPETTPTPAPDPAPPLPKPKPPPRPAAAPVYHAPVHQSTPTPTPQPTYTPPPAVHHAVTKKVVHRQKPHKRVKRQAPKAHVQIKSASVVPVAAVPTASVAAKAREAGKSAFVISGFGLAALTFLMVLTVPATRVRFTPPGRVLMDHQFRLVLVGAGVLLLTALLFAITGTD